MARVSFSAEDMTALRADVDRWIADDPDPADRAELSALLERLEKSEHDGADSPAGELAARFAGRLTFGTAGLRGPVRAGPNGMNTAVVRAAAAGLCAYLDRPEAPTSGPVVIGYDGRHRSAEFAGQTARVVTGSGREALILPRPLPTPVLAFAVRHLNAAAGVMVTASHNPPADNGYKVYDASGAQIVPPTDQLIEAAIQDVGPLAAVPVGPAGTVVDVLGDYVPAVAALAQPGGPRELTTVHTSLHGVGSRTVAAVLTAAGFSAPSVVAEQADPDPDFPTVAFPNPEEPGATDLLIALAADRHADIAIANDPDADRCAIAVPDPAAVPTGWRLLTGDEVGVLLADHLLRRGTRGTYATTIVSSPMLRAIAAEHSVPFAETLTGFKWIMRAGDRTGVPLAFGYEEALGYAVAPRLVADKDGISAALLVAELAATQKAAGARLTDRLDELAIRHGVHATGQYALRVTDLGLITEAMRTVRAGPPATLAGQAVTTVEDLLPDADVVTVHAGGAAARLRLVVRPSGTEPKLKAYLAAVVPVTGGDLPAARARAAHLLAALHAECRARFEP
jgi:phosphomannomutase